MRTTIFHRVLVLAVALMASACGGGDPDVQEQPVPSPHVDCKARPELCT